MGMGFRTFIGTWAGCSRAAGSSASCRRAPGKRPALLLDEATSHLDVYKEKQVNDAISALNIMRIIIAHRLETLASADRVTPFASLTQPAQPERALPRQAAA